MRSNLTFTVTRTRFVVTAIALLFCFLMIAHPVAADTTHVALVITDDRETYLATVTGYGIERYAITEPGFLGEIIAAEVANVTITSRDDPALIVSYTEKRGEYRFKQGNYTISYDAPVIANGISLSFIDAVDITAIFPPGADLSNRMLATMQPMASSIEVRPDDTTIMTWDNVRGMSVRFSDERQVELLWLFAQFLVIVAIMMLLPFFFAPKTEKMQIPEKKPIKRRR